MGALSALISWQGLLASTIEGASYRAELITPIESEPRSPDLDGSGDSFTFLYIAGIHKTSSP
jgi:hypothetical protein